MFSTFMSMFKPPYNCVFDGCESWSPASGTWIYIMMDYICLGIDAEYG